MKRASRHGVWVRFLLCLTATALTVCSACSSHLGPPIDARNDGGGATAGSGGGQAGRGGSDAGICTSCPVEIAVGDSFSCARRHSGTVACWGADARGQLGDGPATHSSCTMMVACSTTPVAVAEITDAIQIAAGGDHACALLASGHVVCWGENFHGQVGDGTTTDRHAPVAVTGISDVVEIALGMRHTCARRASGSVVCWGEADHGELGDGVVSHESCGAVDCSRSPVAVVGLGDAVGLAAGFGHTCALRPSAAVVCWGNGQFGALGNGTTTSHATPQPVMGLDDAFEIGAAQDRSCARRAAGSVVCWGQNIAGELGDGSLSHTDCFGNDCSLVPVPVVGLSEVIALTLGAYHTCAANGRGGILCWGSDSEGQLGDGTSALGTCPSLGRACSPVPVAASGVTDAIEVSAGWAHACALRATGSVVCWGDGRLGQLGNGMTTLSDVPVGVALGPIP